MDDYQVVGLLLAALFAGQHTSSITTTWTIMNLLHNPTEYTRAMDEVTRTFGPNPADTRAETFNFDALQSMDYLFNVVKESLRLSPPLIMLMRKAEVPLEVCGYTVPKGNLVFTSPAVSMNLPNSSPDCCFKDADKFDPDRYLPPRSEDKGRPFAFSAFGGGRHGCLGEMFGFLQVKAVASMILRQFELEPVVRSGSGGRSGGHCGWLQGLSRRKTAVWQTLSPLSPSHPIPAPAPAGPQAQAQLRGDGGGPHDGAPGVRRAVQAPQDAAAGAVQGGHQQVGRRSAVVVGGGGVCRRAPRCRRR